MTALLLALLLASCSSPFGGNAEGYEVLETPLMDAWRATAAFRYQAEDGALDYWKSPREFERDGGGDCEDFAAYMIYLLGPKASMAIVRNKSGGLHAMVLWEGDLLEPQMAGFMRTGGEPLWTLGYDYVMRRSTGAGSKGFEP